MGAKQGAKGHSRGQTVLDGNGTVPALNWQASDPRGKVGLAQYLIHAAGNGFRHQSRPLESQLSRGGGRRGMMISRAVETGVLGHDERVRDAAAAAYERP